jgi:hypothetical protein
MRKIIRPWLF